MEGGAFFSFTRLFDDGLHHAYNAWHQLDHRPENLALAGVSHGERWVQDPTCRRLQAADGTLGATHYVNMYWLRPPLDDSVREWQELAERSFQWGRRPEISWCERQLMGFFAPLSGRSADRVAVSAGALPFRPCRGVHLTLWLPGEDATSRGDVEDAAAGLCALPGVAGVWEFASFATTVDPGWSARSGSTTFEPRGGVRGHVRLRLVYLDDDPAAVVDGVRSARGWPGRRDALLFDGPLRTIRPWHWDWFAGGSAPTPPARPG